MEIKIYRRISDNKSVIVYNDYGDIIDYKPWYYGIVKGKDIKFLSDDIKNRDYKIVFYKDDKININTQKILSKSAILVVNVDLENIEWVKKYKEFHIKDKYTFEVCEVYSDNFTDSYCYLDDFYSDITLPDYMLSDDDEIN